MRTTRGTSSLYESTTKLDASDSRTISPVLFAEQPQRVIRRVKRALVASPNDAGLLSDLAVAYLASSEEPENLVYALASADRAVKLAPNLPEAWFNLAVSLEHLGVLSEARTSWEKYLELDPKSEWAGEANSRVSVIKTIVAAKPWEEERIRLEQASARGDESQFRSVVSRSPQPARVYAEEVLLPKWAEAKLGMKVEGAESALRIARAIGAALVAHANDRMLQDAVAAIDRTTSPKAAGSLTDGHRLFGNALEFIKKGDYQSAYPVLLRAREALESGRSPFAAWASFYLALADYQHSDYQEALDLLDQVQTEARSQRYRSLEGRSLWLRGTIMVFQARYAEALNAYQQARSLFLALGESLNLIAVDTLLAKNLDLLGDSSGAWEYRIEALERVARNRDDHRLRVTLSEAAWAVVEMGEPAAALYLQEEATQIARKMTDPLALPAALRQLAAIRFKSGDPDGAIKDLSNARVAAASLKDSGIRLSMDTEMAIVEAEAEGQRDPSDALQHLNEAIDNSLNMGDRVFLANLYFERAKIFDAQGIWDSAETDLLRAIQERESQRGAVAGDLQRVSFFDRSEDIIQEMVDFQLRVRSNPSRALGFIEADRARVLLDWLSGLPITTSGNQRWRTVSSRPLESAALCRRIPVGVVAIEYFLSRDGLNAWVINHEKVLHRALIANREILPKLLRDLDNSIRVDSGPKFLDISAALYDLIMRPLQDLLPSTSELVIIPDSSLALVPFSALFDRITHQYVFEKWLTLKAPSLNIYVRALARSFELREQQVKLQSLLAIGDPAFDRNLFPMLSRLPRAAVEVQSIASTFSEAEVVTGEKATKKSFFEQAFSKEVFHFAGHAIIDTRNPLLSMFLLSPDRTSNDAGTLYLYEIAAQRLPKTGLAVLSACDTGKGRVSVSEGVLNLAEPFLAAGVPAVIASLWEVDDKGGLIFFREFYRGLAAGRRPATALREAQRYMARGGDESISYPRTWAAFEMIGGALPE